jgi:hypothetical protein
VSKSAIQKIMTEEDAIEAGYRAAKEPPAKKK